MKTKLFVAVPALLAAGAIVALAQTTAPALTNNAQADALELLRRTIAEQQSNPGRIVRTETSPNAQQAIRLSPEAAARRADLERQYLDGKLSARNYQKAVDQLEAEEKKRLAAEAANPKKAKPTPPAATTKKVPAANTSAAKAPAARATSPKNIESAIVTPPAGTVTPAATTEPTPQQKKIADVEARIDEMLRLKAEREKALTNTVAASTNAPAAPLTRRQRLDSLLKQNLEGKISDADYQAQRTKLLAEPE